MEKLNQKRMTLLQALETLDDAIRLYHKAEKHGNEVTLSGKEISFEYNEVVIALRDSLVQRFEYCVDLLWKFLKLYLEQESKIDLEMKGPKNLVRSAVTVGFLTEDQAQEMITMIDSRNLTSHIYREEIAQDICKSVPEYYKLMYELVEKTE